MCWGVTFGGYLAKILSLKSGNLLYSHLRALRALQRSLRLPGGCVQLKLNLFLHSKEVILWSIVLSFLWEFLK